MRIITMLASLLLTGVLTAPAQNPTPKGTTAASSGSTLTGCLKGKTDQYYIMESNGKRHSLMSSQDLSSFVNHQVTVTGKADTSRATGGDAHGHRMGLFSVSNVSDQGPCKK